MALQPHELFAHAATLLQQHQPVALCIIVATRGSTPASAGAVMLVDEAATMLGSVGGGCIEAEVRRAAHERMSSRENALIRHTLDHDRAWEDGLICGGTLDIAITFPTSADALNEIADAYRRGESQPYAFDVSTEFDVNKEHAGVRLLHYVYEMRPPPTLLIAGGGHIGGEVCRYALDLGFRVIVFDDRADILERFVPPAADHRAGPIHEGLAAAEVDTNTFVVIATRGHRHDARALQAMIGRPAAYIGMIGSRRKVKVTFDDLEEEGIDPAQLKEVHAPIGLDIGSVTIPEIAVSIVAQLVQVRRSQFQSPVTGPTAVHDESASSS